MHETRKRWLVQIEAKMMYINKIIRNTHSHDDYRLDLRRVITLLLIINFISDNKIILK